MTKSLYKSIIHFLAEEDGPTAVEYAIVLSMIAGICIASVNFMADKTIESFDSSRIAIEAAN
jgi:pilus assembly protein Flp/PilA